MEKAEEEDGYTEEEVQVIVDWLESLHIYELFEIKKMWEERFSQTLKTLN